MTARPPLRTRLDEAALEAPTPATPVGPLLVDLEAAARALSVAPRTLRRLAASGALPYARLGRMLRFRPEDLRVFADRVVVGPVAFPHRGRRAAS